MTVYFVTVALMVGIYLLIALYVRPQVAIGIVVPLTWLFPAWSGLSIGIEMIDIKTSVSILALCIYCIMPKATFPWRWVPSDFALLALIIANLLSDFWHNGFQLWVPAFAYVEWMVPYLAGRLAFQKWEDVQWIWPVVAFVGIFLGAMALIEALCEVNLYEYVFGERPLDGVPRFVTRWGIRRAYGICFHPLYFGVLLSWLFAWQIYPAWRAIHSQSNNAWLLAPVFGFLAPLATGSRGPFLANTLVILAMLFCRFKKLRLGIFIAVSVAAIGFAIVQEPLLNSLDNWSGETDHGRELKKLDLNEHVEMFSSARARLTLFKIFWTPLKNAGLLGYGSEALSTFPPNAPTGTDEIQAMRDIWSVDNTYILITLRFGYLGLACFLLLGAVSLVQLTAICDRDPATSHSICLTTVFGSIVTVLALIFTVWMPAEFGFPLIWCFGVSSAQYHEFRKNF